MNISFHYRRRQYLMRYLYLDHNVYIEALKNEELKKALLELKNKKIQCVYSPAHIEEIYKVSANKNSPYKEKMGKLIKLISEITSNIEVFPTITSLVLHKEDPNACYDRVKNFDTRSIVENDSCERYMIDKDNYEKLSNKNEILKIEPEEIWKYPAIDQCITDFNKNRDRIIAKHNTENSILCLLGIDKSLPSNFCLEQGNFLKLKKSHTQLEYTIEILFRILNFSGYHSEKDKHTSISGTHDVSHAIYATKANILISADYKFTQKCKAVYKFLGVQTFIIYCKPDDIINVINKNLE